MKKYIKNWSFLLYTIIIGLLFIILSTGSYFPSIFNHYVVPPGDDSFVHLSELYRYANQGFHLNNGYPFGFHYLTYIFSVLLNLSFIQAMVILYPSLFISAGLTLWWVCYKLIDRTTALISLVIFTFFTRQPMQTLFDGGFPNVLAAYTLLPLAFYFYIKLFTGNLNKSKITSFFAFILLSVAILLTHHLTSLYLLAIITVSLPILLFLKFYQEKMIKKATLLSLGSVFGISLIIALILKTGLLTKAVTLTEFFIQPQVNFPFIKIVGSLHDYNSMYHNLSQYKAGLGELVTILSLLCLPIVIYQVVVDRTKRLAYIFVLIWLSTLFIASRLTFLGYPVRPARDLINPMIIVCAIGLSTLYKEKKLFLNISFVILLVFLVRRGPIRDLQMKWSSFTQNSPMVRMTYQDKIFVDYIDPSKKVVIFGNNIFMSIFRPNGITSHFALTKEKINSTDLSQYDYIIIDYPTSSATWPEQLYKFDQKDIPIKNTLQLKSEQIYKTVYLYQIEK